MEGWRLLRSLDLLSIWEIQQTLLSLGGGGGRGLWGVFGRRGRKGVGVEGGALCRTSSNRASKYKCTAAKLLKFSIFNLIAKNCAKTEMK